MELKPGDVISSPYYEPAKGQGEPAADWLVKEYEASKRLFQAQPVQVQHFIVSQSRALADALLAQASHACFSLPDRMVVTAGDSSEIAIPSGLRQNNLGGLMDRLRHVGLIPALRRRLDKLEASTLPAIAASASLLRYTTAAVLVRDMLPAGRSVRYQALPGEDIPSLPVHDVDTAGSAFTAATDVIAEEGDIAMEAGRGEVLVPYVPYAQQFYLPQWVAFDDTGQLLVHSIAEAEAHLASMQGYLKTLHAAVSLAPYMLADEIYQRKRYGILGQLVNQGRALARYEVILVVETIRRRVADGKLNRGLSLSLDYFDDQHLVMKSHDFDVIPAGRIMFVPAFVVLAARREQAKVDQDTRLSLSTRSHLLDELRMLEGAFFPGQQK